MRNYRTNSGPFIEKPFFKLADIESICSDELRKVDLLPATPSPIRIDRFIEKKFLIQPTYDALPDGLLGFTRFGKDGVEEIVVTKALDEEGTRPAERRLRTTLAHEGGHGLLHAHLFAFGTRPDFLFGGQLASDAPKILCRDDAASGVSGDAVKKPPYRWWEFQANQAMGALLLPQMLVAAALDTKLAAGGMLGMPVLPSKERESAVGLLSELFDVNPIVARIRLEALYPVSAEQQLTL
ncbi:MAG TPA: hypothetical protein VGG72_20960 [Bryobacteraceae bacterium]|jgi:hypothetical protein